MTEQPTLPGLIPAEPPEPKYVQIYAVVRKIPSGKVLTYGQVATLVGGCSARMVGYAMAALKSDQDVPWQRVINRQGKISPHGDGFGSMIQRSLLEAEGVMFDQEGCIDLKQYGLVGLQYLK
jgi:methylated-DNA-protein-cysteine methyltransferase related protein